MFWGRLADLEDGRLTSQSDHLIGFRVRLFYRVKEREAMRSYSQKAE